MRTALRTFLTIIRQFSTDRTNDDLVHSIQCEILPLGVNKGRAPVWHAPAMYFGSVEVGSAALSGSAGGAVVSVDSYRRVARKTAFTKKWTAGRHNALSQCSPLSAEEVQATENLPPAEFRVGYVKRLPAEHANECHFVAAGRDLGGLYHWEERPGPEPNEAKGNFPALPSDPCTTRTKLTGCPKRGGLLQLLNVRERIGCSIKA